MRHVIFPDLCCWLALQEVTALGWKSQTHCWYFWCLKSSGCVYSHIIYGIANLGNPSHCPPCHHATMPEHLTIVIPRILETR